MARSDSQLDRIPRDLSKLASSSVSRWFDLTFLALWLFCLKFFEALSCSFRFQRHLQLFSFGVEAGDVLFLPECMSIDLQWPENFKSVVGHCKSPQDVLCRFEFHCLTDLVPEF